MSPLTRSRSLLAATAAAALLALPAAAAARDTTVRSFDGTSLVVHFFPAAHLKHGARVPTVLVGPGWSAPGSTNENGATSTGGGAVGIGPLRRAGYNVLTWDPRGFGGSGGTVEIDSPKFEGRDVSALIDYVARQPEAQLDGRRDPRVGMAGPSYGGGIQLVAAAIDHRIDAIVPDIAWNSLQTSLGKNDTVKSGWGLALYAASAAAGARLDPEIVHERDAGGRLVPPGRGKPRLLHLARAGGPGLPHQGAHAADPGDGGHALHAARGGDQLRPAARPRRADQDALVLRRARYLPHQAGRHRADPARHAGVVRALPEGPRVGSPPGRASSGSTRTAAPTRLPAGRSPRARRWRATARARSRSSRPAARVPRWSRRARWARSRPRSPASSPPPRPPTR